MVYRPQIINLDGKTEVVIMPVDEWRRIEHSLNEYEDKKSILNWKQQTTETLPHDFVEQIVLGNNPIQTWRKYRDLSQKELSTLCNISSAYLSQLETGKRTPSVDLLKKLAKYLNADTDDLIC